MAFSSPKASSSLEQKVRRGWIVVCALVGLALTVSQLLEIPARSALRGYDNTFNYLWLRSAAVDHDWDFRNDLQECNTLTPEYRASALTLPTTATGRIPNKYGIGWAVLSAPFYLLADLIVAVGRELHVWSYGNDGFNPVYQICIQIGHSGLAVAAWLLSARTISIWLGARRHARVSASARPNRTEFDGPQALASEAREDYDRGLLSVALVWAASPLIYYQSVNVSMSHGAAFFVVALMAYAVERAMRETRSDGWWVLVGICFGLAVTVRYQLAVFGLPIIWAFNRLRSERRSFVRAIALVAVGAMPMITLQAFAWHSVYGEWFVFSYGAEGEQFHWGKPALWHSFFSSWHGLLYWHPFLLLGFAGIALWVRDVRDGAVAWAGAVAAIVYINAAWWCWWFASAFGNRGFDAALLPLMGGTAWLLTRLKHSSRMLLMSVGIACGFWNFYVVLLYRSGAISRSDPVTWSQMLEAAGRLGDAVKF